MTRTQNGYSSALPLNPYFHGTETITIKVGSAALDQTGYFTVHKLLACIVCPTIRAHFQTHLHPSQLGTYCLPRFHPNVFHVIYQWMYAGYVSLPIRLETVQAAHFWGAVRVMCTDLGLTKLQAIVEDGLRSEWVRWLCWCQQPGKNACLKGPVGFHFVAS